MKGPKLKATASYAVMAECPGKTLSVPCTVYLVNTDVHKNESSYKYLHVPRGRKLKTGYIRVGRTTAFSRIVSPETGLCKWHQLNNSTQQIFTFFDNMHNTKLVLTEYSMVTLIWQSEVRRTAFCYDVLYSNTRHINVHTTYYAIPIHHVLHWWCFHLVVVVGLCVPMTHTAIPAVA
jgi:hypothetical protein